MFSKRGSFDLALNSVSRAAADAPPIWDLTVSNPTRVDLAFDDETLRHTLCAADPTRYDPQPRGLPSARRALAEQLDWNPEQLLLTATTSEAYSFLMKLFCDPGDHVLIPEPSYPLLPMLARLEGAVGVPYALRYDGEWHIDRQVFLERLDSRPRLILAVSPNNPTGAYLSDEDLDFLLSHGVAVVIDEVFAPYDLRRAQASPLRHSKASSGLLFALGGLSKAAALPQTKLSWIAVSGDDAQTERALAQLELIADTYLSANELAQRALPSLLSTAAAERRDRVFARLQQNQRSMSRLQQDVPEISALPVQGGWYQVLRLPRVQSEEQWVLDFLHRGVLVQPGWFYDFPDEAWMVLSLLTPPQVFTEGLSHIAEAVMASGR